MGGQHEGGGARGPGSAHHRLGPWAEDTPLWASVLISESSGRPLHSDSTLHPSASWLGKFLDPRWPGVARMTSPTGGAPVVSCGCHSEHFLPHSSGRQESGGKVCAGRRSLQSLQEEIPPASSSVSWPQAFSAAALTGPLPLLCVSLIRTPILRFKAHSDHWG